MFISRIFFFLLALCSCNENSSTNMRSIEPNIISLQELLENSKEFDSNLIRTKGDLIQNDYGLFLKSETIGTSMRIDYSPSLDTGIPVLKISDLKRKNCIGRSVELTGVVFKERNSNEYIISAIRYIGIPEDKRKCYAVRGWAY